MSLVSDTALRWLLLYRRKWSISLACRKKSESARGSQNSLIGCKLPVQVSGPGFWCPWLKSQTRTSARMIRTGGLVTVDGVIRAKW